MKNKKEIKDHDNNHEKKTKMSRRPRNHTPLIREKRKKDPMRWGGFGPEAMLVKQAIDFEDQTYPEAMGRVRAWLKQHHMVVVVKPDFCNADCWDPDMGYVNSVMEDDSLGEVYYCRRCAEKCPECYSLWTSLDGEWCTSCNRENAQIDKLNKIT